MPNEISRSRSQQVICPPSPEIMDSIDSVGLQFTPKQNLKQESEQIKSIRKTATIVDTGFTVKQIRTKIIQAELIHLPQITQRMLKNQK